MRPSAKPTVVGSIPSTMPLCGRWLNERTGISKLHSTLVALSVQSWLRSSIAIQRTCATESFHRTGYFAPWEAHTCLSWSSNGSPTPTRKTTCDSEPHLNYGEHQVLQLLCPMHSTKHSDCPPRRCP